MKNKLIEYIEEYEQYYKFELPNSLLSFIEEIQKILTFAFEIEKLDPSLVPKLVLGEDDISKKSDETMSYDKPYLFINLNRRAYCGENLKSTMELFKGNIVSGVPKYHTKKIISDEYEVEDAVFYSENEFLLTLKTKTVKEQFILINIIERALNIYSRKIMSKFVNNFGIKEIKTIEKKDKERFTTTQIFFQARLAEKVEVDNSYILKGFAIFSGEEIEHSSFKLDTDGNWEDNVIDENYEYFN